jgi:hypothetical protein
MPPPSAMLRMVAFAVAAGLGMAGVQPVVAASTGAVPIGWALGLTAPAVATALVVFVVGRVVNRRDSMPPWYSAWLLLPGSFLLAGAAAMCIFGALVEFALIAPATWALLVAGGVLWTAALVLVRKHSH